MPDSTNFEAPVNHEEAINSKGFAMKVALCPSMFTNGLQCVEDFAMLLHCLVHGPGTYE